MDKQQGFIKLWRGLKDHDLWLKERFTKGQAWADLLMLANHQDGFFFVRGNKIEVKRGQVGWSMLALGKRWQWDNKTVKVYLAFLRSIGMLEYKSDSRTTLITIANYRDGQDKFRTDSLTDSEQTPNRLPNRTDTNKNIKNDKNDKNKALYATKQFIKPTVQEVTDYASSICFELDALYFIDSYEAVGWMRGKMPIRDWKAVVRTWKSRQVEQKVIPIMRQRFKEPAVWVDPWKEEIEKERLNNGKLY